MRGRSAGSLAADVAHVVAVRAVRFDGDDARALQLAQQRRVRVADGGDVVAGRGGGARAFEQALDVGLHLPRDRGGRVLGGGGRDLDRFVLVGRALRQRLLARSRRRRTRRPARAGSRAGARIGSGAVGTDSDAPWCWRARWPTSSAVAPRLHARASSGQRASFLGSSAHHFTSSGVSGYFGIVAERDVPREHLLHQRRDVLAREAVRLHGRGRRAGAAGRRRAAGAGGRRRAARRRQREHEREHRARSRRAPSAEGALLGERDEPQLDVPAFLARAQIDVAEEAHRRDQRHREQARPARRSPSRRRSNSSPVGYPSCSTKPVTALPSRSIDIAPSAGSSTAASQMPEAEPDPVARQRAAARQRLPERRALQQHRLGHEDGGAAPRISSVQITISPRHDGGEQQRRGAGAGSAPTNVRTRVSAGGLNSSSPSATVNAPSTSSDSAGAQRTTAPPRASARAMRRNASSAAIGAEHHQRQHAERALVGEAERQRQIQRVGQRALAQHHARREQVHARASRRPARCGVAAPARPPARDRPQTSGS